MNLSSLRALQVWGSGTGVGKTVASGCLAAHSESIWRNIRYLKPVQTGFPVDDDSKLVERLGRRNDIKVKSLVTYEKPISPHRAWEDSPVSDSSLLAQVQSQMAMWDGNPTIVETAGGVLSPAPSGNLQADVFRPLRLPSLLVGDGRLGGISATLSAYESLATRGYDVPFILVFGTAHENHLAISRDVDAKVFVAEELPELPVPLEPYVDRTDVRAVFTELCSDVSAWWKAREKRLQGLADEARGRVWWPFTQHASTPNVLVIDSAQGDNFTVAVNGGRGDQTSLETQFDACASWWTSGLGHGNPQLSLEAAKAAGRYGHVIFPEAIHEPAMDLTNSLLDGVGKGWAERVFFSDNGSTAIEVALKMALRKRAVDLYGQVDDFPWQDMKVISFEGSYHGDTLGVMDCCPSSAFNALQFPWYKPRALFFDPPTVRLSNALWTVSSSETETFSSRKEVFNVERRLESDLAKTYRSHIVQTIEPEKHILGGVLMEPVLQGAGGMRLIDPLFQRIMVEECRRRGIPIIFDEVFTGFWRLGSLSGADMLGVKPDIAAYAKLLTGGLLPLAVTLASKDVFKAFDGETKREALLHGHSYTAHPIGCRVGHYSLEQYRKLFEEGNHKGEYWEEAVSERLSRLPCVSGVVNLGTVLAVELKTEERWAISDHRWTVFSGEGTGYAATGAVALAKAMRSVGVYARPLGNVLYVMCTLVTDRATCNVIASKLEQEVDNYNSERENRNNKNVAQS